MNVFAHHCLRAQRAPLTGFTEANGGQIWSLFAFYLKPNHTRRDKCAATFMLTTLKCPIMSQMASNCMNDGSCVSMSVIILPTPLWEINLLSRRKQLDRKRRPFPDYWFWPYSASTNTAALRYYTSVTSWQRQTVSHPDYYCKVNWTCRYNAVCERDWWSLCS